VSQARVIHEPRSAGLVVAAVLLATAATLGAGASSGCGASAPTVDDDRRPPEEPEPTVQEEVAAYASPEQAPPEAPPPSMGFDDYQVVRTYEHTVEKLETDLSEIQVAVSIDPAPRCAEACELVGEICQLADRVCSIAQRHPEFGDVIYQCRDSERRCERAGDEVVEVCTCDTFEWAQP
jgi:hypothetical protein